MDWVIPTLEKFELNQMKFILAASLRLGMYHALHLLCGQVWLWHRPKFRFQLDDYCKVTMHLINCKLGGGPSWTQVNEIRAESMPQGAAAPSQKQTSASLLWKWKETRHYRFWQWIWFQRGSRRPWLTPRPLIVCQNRQLRQVCSNEKRKEEMINMEMSCA